MQSSSLRHQNNIIYNISIILFSFLSSVIDQQMIQNFKLHCACMNLSWINSLYSFWKNITEKKTFFFHLVFFKKKHMETKLLRNFKSECIGLHKLIKTNTLDTMCSINLRCKQDFNACKIFWRNKKVKKWRYWKAET